MAAEAPDKIPRLGAHPCCSLSRELQVELYDILIGDNIEQLQTFVKNKLPLKRFTGTEIMMIETIHCEENHDMMFESGKALDASGWLAVGSCCCERETLDGNDDEDTVYCGIHPVHVAVHNNNIKLLLELVQLGASVNEKTLHHCFTPLCSAITLLSECLPMVQTLQACGADLDATSRIYTYSKRAIHLAAGDGNEALLRFLLDQGVEMNRCDSRQRSPLLMATSGGHLPCVRLLVERGVDVNIASSQGITPLFYAVRQGAMEIARVIMLAPACDVNVKPTRGFSSMGLLHLAIQQSEAELVAELLDLGADLNDKAETGLTPLMLTVYTNTPNITRLLINKGASVNEVNDHGYGPLHNACWDGLMEITKLLLAANAQHDMRTNDGNTPLSLACHGDQPDMVELLLPLGCNVNNQDKDQDEPLHYTTYNGDIVSSTLLLQCGARPDSPNRLACTPLWNAAYKANHKVIRLLLRHNPDLSIKSVGIQQEAQTEGVTECFPFPRSVLYAACWGTCQEREEDSGTTSVEILLRAGVKVTQECWLQEWLGGQQPNWVSDELMATLREELRCPAPLIRLCRTTIRDILRGWCDLQTQVNLMEIPLTLRAYLTTQHL